MNPETNFNKGDFFYFSRKNLANFILDDKLTWSENNYYQFIAAVKEGNWLNPCFLDKQIERLIHTGLIKNDLTTDEAGFSKLVPEFLALSQGVLNKINIFETNPHQAFSSEFYIDYLMPRLKKLGLSFKEKSYTLKKNEQYLLTCDLDLNTSFCILKDMFSLLSRFLDNQHNCQRHATIRKLRIHDLLRRLMPFLTILSKKNIFPIRQEVTDQLDAILIDKNMGNDFDTFYRPLTLVSNDILLFLDEHCDESKTAQVYCGLLQRIYLDYDLSLCNFVPSPNCCLIKNDGPIMSTTLTMSAIFNYYSYLLNGNSCIKIRYFTGPFRTFDIYEAMTSNIRLAEVAWTGVSSASIVHDHIPTAYSMQHHDLAHAYMLSHYPLIIRTQLLPYLVSILQKTGFSISDLIWELQDAALFELRAYTDRISTYSNCEEHNFLLLQSIMRQLFQTEFYDNNIPSVDLSPDFFCSPDRDDLRLLVAAHFILDPKFNQINFKINFAHYFPKAFILRIKSITEPSENLNYDHLILRYRLKQYQLKDYQSMITAIPNALSWHKDEGLFVNGISLTQLSNHPDKLIDILKVRH